MRCVCAPMLQNKSTLFSVLCREQSGAKAKGLYKNEPLITQLTQRLWDRRVRGNTIWLVEFYASWCKHCQSFVATW